MGEAVLGWLIDHVKDSLVFEGSDDFVPIQSISESSASWWKSLVKYLEGFDRIDVFQIIRYNDVDFEVDHIVIGVEIGTYRYDDSLNDLPEKVADFSLKALNEFVKTLSERGREIPQPTVFMASEEIGHYPLSEILEYYSM